MSSDKRTFSVPSELKSSNPDAPVEAPTEDQVAEFVYVNPASPDNDKEWDEFVRVNPAVVGSEPVKHPGFEEE